ncbi:MAG: NUDIX domain-containing protein [Candidatus Dojkabacteria bacterium]
MNQNEMPHYLQVKILVSLAKADRQKFSEIEGFENIPMDQLNYHLKTLIRLGYIDKDNSGYFLTTEGKQFVSFLDIESNKKEITPKVSIWTLIRNKENSDKILMSKRLKHPFLGMYGFVTGKVRAGETLESTMTREVFEETGLEVTKSHLIGVARWIDLEKGSGKFLHDAFFHQFEVLDYEGDLLEKTLESENVWKTINEIKSLGNLLLPSVKKYFDEIGKGKVQINFEENITDLERF